MPEDKSLCFYYYLPSFIQNGLVSISAENNGSSPVSFALGDEVSFS